MPEDSPAEWIGPDSISFVPPDWCREAGAKKYIWPYMCEWKYGDLCSFSPTGLPKPRIFSSLANSSFSILHVGTILEKSEQNNAEESTEG